MKEFKLFIIEFEQMVMTNRKVSVTAEDREEAVRKCKDMYKGSVTVLCVKKGKDVIKRD